MKIFEITNLKEVDVSQLSRQLQGLISNISSKVQRFTAQPAASAQPDTTDDARAERNADTQSSGNSDADSMVDEAAAQIRSGEAQLSRDIDAELGKREADPQNIHIQIMGKVQDATRSLVTQIQQQNNLSRTRMNMLLTGARMKINAAAFGYINKKYLNGSDFSDGNYNFQTMDVITRALQSQAPRGAAQPAGRVSSARPQGQQGTVPSGGGTNALDARADDF